MTTISTFPIHCNIATQKLNLSADRSMLFTFHNDNTIRIWNTVTFDLLQEITFHDHVRDFASSPDNRFLAIITADEILPYQLAKTSIIHIYDLASNKLSYSQNASDCRCIEFVTNQTFAVGRLTRGTLETRDLVDFFHVNNFQVVSSVELPQLASSFKFAVIPNRNLLLSLGIGLVVIDSIDKQVLHDINCDTLRPGWDIWETTSLAISQNARFVALGFDAYYGATGIGGKRVCIFDTNLWQPLEWHIDDVDYPTNLAISDDGKLLATTLARKNSIFLTEIGSGKLRAEVKLEGVSSFAFLPESHRLVVGSESQHPLVVLSGFDS